MSARDYVPADELYWALTDALTDVPQSPSALARRARVANTGHVYATLRWMVANHSAVTVGNGAWTKYRARRFGEAQS